MSVHLTVNNPICIRRERRIFADREQIKKQERERRKRLRIEQVRQQSKDISSNVLERTKEETRKKLSQLEKNENSELKRMHERKIMEIHQKYQEDMGDIGLAHNAALDQPNATAIKVIKTNENRVNAAERGKEAIQRLKKASKSNPADVKRERLRQVREVENIRSSMISNIPKRRESPSKKLENHFSDIPISAQNLQNDFENIDSIKLNVSPEKRKQKKITEKKSFKKSHGKIISHLHKPKSSQQVVVEVHREDVSSLKDDENQLNQKTELNVDANEDDIEYVICSSNNQHTSHLNVEKNEKLKSVVHRQDGQHLEYNPNDYRQQTSGGSTVSSSSLSSLLSDDSSYFSDVVIATNVPQNTPINISRTHLNKSPKKQTVCVQQKKHDPKYLVQKIDINNDLNAEDRAQIITEQELVEKNLSNEKKSSLIREKRGIEALARERTRRNYSKFLENLDTLTRDKRKLEALNIHKSRQRVNRNQSQCKRFHVHQENVLNDVICYDDNSEEVFKKDTTELPHCSEFDDYKSPGQWEKSYNLNDEDNSLSRNDQILEMLKKVERQKQYLLKEFGDTLPETIRIISKTPLFSEDKSEKVYSTAKNSEIERRASPEIKVIDVSKECSNKKEKLKKKDKKKKIDVAEKNEVAIQTSQLDQTSGENKSVQVEMPSDRIKHIMIPRKSKDSNKLEYVEPIVTIITHGEVSSNESIGRHGIVINVGNGTIKERISQKVEQYELEPEIKTSPRAKTRSLPSNSPVKRASTNTVTSTSAPNSRSGSPVKIQDSTDSTESPEIVAEKVFKYPRRSPKKTKKKLHKSSPHETSNQFDRYVLKNLSNIESTISNRNYHTLKQKISYTDNSEASSSYASLSAIKSSSNTRYDDVTSILQLLDSTLNDKMRGLAKEMTPVSTPETPSSHIINMPSNNPRFNRISRILNFSAVNDDELGKNEKKMMFIKHEKQHQQLINREQNISDNVGCNRPCCSCKSSSSYQTLNENLGEIIRRKDKISEQDFLIHNKFKDLKIECKEHINTIDTMIEEIRKNQGMEQSMLTRTTETSFNQILPSKDQESDITYYKKKEQDIETLNNHLLKTCTEYQETNLKSSPSLSPIVMKNKPKILKQETVNVDLRRFKKKQPDSPISKEDNTVEKLSHEILELSKKLVKHKALDDISFEDETIHYELPGTSTGAVLKLPTSSPRNEDEQTTFEHLKKTGNDQNFKPILGDIPKITKNRVESRIDGRRQELSTIEELDTPDTGTRSITSVKSPSVKSQRVYVDTNLSKYMVSNNIINVQNNNNFPILSNIGNASVKEQTNEKTDQKELVIKDFNKFNGVPISDKNHEDDENNKQLVVSLSKNFNGINGKQQLKIDESLDSFLIHCSARNVEIKSELITSSSFSNLSGFSDIVSSETTPTSDTMTLPPEKMEDYLMGLGLAWLIPTVRKTREASAQSSSSNSDITIAMAKQTKSPIKKLINNSTSALPGFSDVSSISIREASKSTEKTVLMKGRTSTPNISNFHYTSEKSSVITTSTSGGLSLPDQSDGIIKT